MNIDQKENVNPMFNDPIHGVMEFPYKYKELIKKIVEKDIFQRLRHIKQLGMIDLVFPGAVHTRFSHCLGAAYIALNMAKALKLEPEYEVQALISALLHDIGHGPFSHCFEKLFEENGKIKIKHEDWTEKFLEDYDFDNIKFRDEDSGLKNFKIDKSKIKQFITHKYNKDSDTKLCNNDNLVADIISSQLDADRMDYLLRDSHFCGVKYGNVDIDWIISQITKIDELEKSPRLGIYYKGWRAAEHFLLCRRIITQNVYHHHTKEVLEKLLIALLKNLLDLLGNNNQWIDCLNLNDALKQFLKNLYVFRNSNTAKEAFINENYDFYKKLTDYDIWMVIRDLSNLRDVEIPKEAKELASIAKKIYGRNLNKCVRFDTTVKDEASKIIEDFKKSNHLYDWQIFIAEKQVRSYDSEEDPILIKDVNGRIDTIDKYSKLLEGIQDQTEKESFLAIDGNINKEILRNLESELDVCGIKLKNIFQLANN
jgi:uncharacterized protein